ncbi:unnamed protein product [Coffea canephora]|uniref:DH200=94 genomic scaffold, scaffold_1908 n=1 Tax=Coffea canephora TaxID=49390 RepID=A0A068VJW1_COFCA|nr:unnamed protein product [Coffea canephora]
MVVLFLKQVVNTSPWVITVAASSIDRAFPTVLILWNNPTLLGQSLYIRKDSDKFYPIVYGEDVTTTDGDEDAARSASAAATNVKEVEGVGLIFARFPTKEVALCLDVPCVQVDYATGASLLAYIGTTNNPIVKFSLPKTSLGQQLSPPQRLFSSLLKDQIHSLPQIFWCLTLLLLWSTYWPLGSLLLPYCHLMPMDINLLQLNSR